MQDTSDKESLLNNILHSADISITAFLAGLPLENSIKAQPSKLHYNMERQKEINRFVHTSYWYNSGNDSTNTSNDSGIVNDSHDNSSKFGFPIKDCNQKYSQFNSPRSESNCQSYQIRTNLIPPDNSMPRLMRQQTQPQSRTFGRKLLPEPIADSYLKQSCSQNTLIRRTTHNPSIYHKKLSNSHSTNMLKMLLQNPKECQLLCNATNLKESARHDSQVPVYYHQNLPCSHNTKPKRNVYKDPAILTCTVMSSPHNNMTKVAIHNATTHIHHCQPSTLHKTSQVIDAARLSPAQNGLTLPNSPESNDNTSSLSNSVCECCSKAQHRTVNPHAYCTLPSLVADYEMSPSSTLLLCPQAYNTPKVSS